MNLVIGGKWLGAQFTVKSPCGRALGNKTELRWRYTLCLVLVTHSKIMTHSIVRTGDHSTMTP